MQKLFCPLTLSRTFTSHFLFNQPWIDFLPTRQLAAVHEAKGTSDPVQAAVGKPGFPSNIRGPKFPKVWPLHNTKGLHRPQIK